MLKTLIIASKPACHETLEQKLVKFCFAINRNHSIQKDESLEAFFLFQLKYWFKQQERAEVTERKGAVKW